MGITLGDAILHLRADRSELESGLQGATGGITSWIGGLQGALTTGIVGAIVGATIKGVRAAADEQTAIAKLEAVYRATGGAIGMTTAELRQLASQLMFTTGIEEEQFMAAEALAMTYGGIAGDQLPRLLTVAADMAALFDGDVVSSTRNVALALSAGEDGLMRLRRAGVIYTDEQKEMIATMMAAGDAAGAQNIILTELEGRFGGTAAANLNTFNGRMTALSTSVDELWEGLGSLNIGGRTLVEWMTDGITTATSLLTIHAQINQAFESTRDQIARNSTTYQDYLEAELDIAVASGKITEAERTRVLVMRASHPTDILSATLYRHIREQLEELGIVMTGSEWDTMRAGFEEDAAAAALLAGELPAVAEAASTVANSFMSVADRARAAFAAVDMGLAGTIENFRTQAAWIAGGGLQLQAAADQTIAALQRGAITPEQADSLFRPIEAAALGLQEEIGAISMSDATATMARDWGLQWGEARTEIGLARDEIATIPEVVRTNIEVAVRYQLYGEGGTPGGHKGQHGLDFDVEGPSGTDQVPVNLALTRGEHVEVTPAGEQGGRVVNNYWYITVNDRDDLQALEQSVMQIFRGI